VNDIGFIGLRRAKDGRARDRSGRKPMKPFSELNRSPVRILYWVLFGWGENCGVRKVDGGPLGDVFE
jgi:hypothetical protein